MADDITKLTLSELSNDPFFKALRDGEFCLVLGAGFSYGLKNKSESEFKDEKFIPVVPDFISVTNRKFNTSFKDNEFQKAADKWKEKITNNEESFSSFKNLFLADEVAFKNSKQLYANILAPGWANIYTFNFDNVLDLLIKNREDEFDVQYYYVGKFGPDHKRNIGYLHNSILQANKVDDLVFTIDTYSEKIEKSDNHLYFSIFNDVEFYKKNIFIIGSSFDEQSLYNFLLTRIKRDAIKIIHINYSKENKAPYFTSTFREKVKDISWINCKAEEFLNFLADNLEKVSMHDPLPKFLELLKRPQKTAVVENLSAQSFNDFLNSQYLSYYSRGKFKQSLRDEIKKEFVSEGDLLKHITEEKFFGVIIHGQGGIGKTRLMLELGKKLISQDFIVIKVLPEFENFDQIVAYFNLRPDKKYLLLFDYIEEQKVFDKTIKWITSNKCNNIKIIGNCRNTFVSDIQNNYSEYLKFIDIGLKSKIGLEKKLERDYKREVILSIINSISDKTLSAQLRNDNVLKSFYQARPSFAAFIKYIHLKNPQNDLSIATDDTFSNWLIKKLKLTTVGKISYREFFEKKKYIFQILSCLPAYPDAASKLEKVKEGDLSFASEINKLIHDGWIDETNQSLKVVHDTVNDTLLLEFFEHFQFRDFYLTDFLEFALATNSISSMMWSIQRVWDDFPDDFTPAMQKSIAKFIDVIFNENIAKENWFKYKLDDTHLISELDRINLIIKHRDLLKENFALEKFGSSLAFSIEWVYENITDEATKKRYSVELKELFFTEWNIDGRFNDFVKDSRGGKIISPYINLFGIDDYIKERFVEYITLVECNENNLKPISFAIASWLNNNGEKLLRINELIKLWFDVYETNPIVDIEPSRLIISWVKSEGRFFVIKDIIVKHLRNFQEDKFTKSIVKLWIKRDWDLSPIRDAVATLLKKYQEDRDSDIIIKYWINKGGDLKTIKETVVAWFLKYNEEKEASYLMQLWINKGGDKGAIDFSVMKWLDKYKEEKDASFLMQLWINKGGDLSTIQSSVMAWLLKFREEKEASFIIQPWIEKSGEIDSVKDSILVWLKTFQAERDSKFILQLWIEKGGNLNEIKEGVIVWLKKFKDDFDAKYLVQKWADRNGDLKFLKEIFPLNNSLTEFDSYVISAELENIVGYSNAHDIALIWLNSFGNKSIAKYPLSSWIKFNGNEASKKIEDWIIFWVENFYDPYKHNWRDDLLLNYCNEKINNE